MVVELMFREGRKEKNSTIKLVLGSQQPSLLGHLNGEGTLLLRLKLHLLCIKKFLRKNKVFRHFLEILIQILYLLKNVLIPL
jgi:hypothetical protein